jgi:hypothetical protein
MTPQARLDLRDRIFGRLEAWDRALMLRSPLRFVRPASTPEWMWTLTCGLLSGHNERAEGEWSDGSPSEYENCAYCGKTFSLAGVA